MKYSKSILAFLALSSFAPAQSNITLNGASGNETFNVARSTTGGLTLGLGFEVEYLLIGGGGGGGGAAGANSGGGGGGQVLSGTASGITNQSYSVTVGSGGAGGISNGTLSQTVGAIGGNSVFSGTGLNLTSRGGGGGAGSLGFNGISVQVANATNGASGGGGSSQSSTTVLGARALGTAGQGSAGGAAIGTPTSANLQSGGGGGGAGGAGGTGSSSAGGAGGVGLSSSITGTARTYGGGGGGGKRSTGSAGAGGQGGGGAGSLNGTGVAGSANTGGGGGGAGSVGGAGSDFAGGNGGSGIVVVRYKGASAGTGGTITTGTSSAAGYTLHTFTNTGTSALDLSELNLSTRLGAVENGVISGTGSLTFNGPGTLTLGGTNTYSGGTTISGGRLIGNVGSIQGNIINNSQLEFNQVSNSSHNFTISGTGSLTKSGAGTLTMSDTNSYSGGTTVSAGKLAGTTAAIQGAVANNAAVEFDQSSNGTYAGAMSGNGSLTKSGTGTVTLSGTNSYSGGTTVSAGKLAGTTTAIQGAVVNNAAVEFDQSSNGTYSGVMSGTGALVKNGAGAITITAANSYTGGTTINSGSLLTSTANRLADSGGVTVASGAIFQLGGNETIASLSGAGQVKVGTATLTTGASHSTFSGTLYGSGDLIKVGGGIFTLSGNNGLSTFTGNTIINDGTLVLASANALNAGTVLTMNGGTLTVNQRTIIGALEQGTGVVNGTGELVSALTLTSSGALNSILADGVDYAAGILKRSEEMTTVGAANTFTGKIIVQGGILRLVEGGSFDADSSLNMSAGGTMDLNNKSQSFSAVNGTGGTVALGNGTLGVDGSSDSNFAGSITGNGSLTKDGSGTLALTGNSSYTGATVVSEGLLVVNGNISTSTMTTIQNGATLGGSGTLGALTVESGGTVTPGNSPGILMTGDYNQAGTLSLELDGALAGVEYDQVNVSGTVNLSGQLMATVGYSPVNDQMLFILINDGSDAIVGNFSGMAHMDTVLLDGYLWQISYTANYTGSNTGTFTGGNDIALKAVPEPSALVLFGLSTFCFITRRRRTA